ncbi:MAG: PqqD family protein [Bacteroidota bacterium]
MHHSEAPTDIPLSFSPHKKAGVMAQQVLDEMVLYDDNTEMGYSLNASARFIWDLCDGERTLGSICEEIARDLEVDAAMLHKDVQTTVSELLKLGLLKSGVEESESASS